MQTKKGFVSFFVFFLLSLSILALSASFHTSTPSISQAYDYKLSYHTHTNLKRAFHPAASLGVSKVQSPGISSPVLPLPIKQKEDLIRLSILNEFSSLCQDYSSISQFDCFYYCEPAPALFPLPNDSLLPSDFNLTNWVHCASHIEIVHTINQTKIRINGFNLRTNNRVTGAQMDSLIEPFEVV